MRGKRSSLGIRSQDEIHRRRTGVIGWREGGHFPKGDGASGERYLAERMVRVTSAHMSSVIQSRLEKEVQNFSRAW
jgi:hypothetical protein